MLQHVHLTTQQLFRLINPTIAGTISNLKDKKRSNAFSTWKLKAHCSDEPKSIFFFKFLMPLCSN